MLESGLLADDTRRERLLQKCPFLLDLKRHHTSRAGEKREDSDRRLDRHRSTPPCHVQRANDRRLIRLGKEASVAIVQKLPGNFEELLVFR